MLPTCVIATPIPPPATTHDTDGNDGSSVPSRLPSSSTCCTGATVSAPPPTYRALDINLEHTV